MQRKDGLDVVGGQRVGGAVGVVLPDARAEGDSRSNAVDPVADSVGN